MGSHFIGSIDCAYYYSWNKKAVSFLVTPVEAFLEEIPGMNNNLFLPQNVKLKRGERTSP